jgi:predicted cupin superfamily sugar epimerase
MASTPPNHLSTISPRALHLINTLNLHYLPYESGYIGLLGTSSHRITTPSNTKLAAQSHNYYMLTSTLRINYLHWLESDDTHILIEGGPVEYFVFHPATDSSLPKVERIVLGRDFEKGQTAIVSVPGGCWKALRLCEGVDFALMGNVLSPEFTSDRVKIGFHDDEERREWVGRYAGVKEWLRWSSCMD